MEHSNVGGKVQACWWALIRHRTMPVHPRTRILHPREVKGFYIVRQAGGARVEQERKLLMELHLTPELPGRSYSSVVVVVDSNCALPVLTVKQP